MDHPDMTGIAAAAAALVLAVGGWAFSPEQAPPMSDIAGLEAASQQALEANAVGQPMQWRGEDGGTAATIIPASAYREFDGSWCRSFAVVLAAEGGAAGSSHVACRDGQGRWRQRVQTVAAGPVTQVAGTLLR